MYYNSMFPSMALAICAMAFLVLIMVMYFSKKKFKSLENSIYRFIMILTMILLILELICVYTMANRDKIPILNEVLCRGYLLGAIIWTTAMIGYIWSLGKKQVILKNDKKYKKYAFVIIALVDLTLFIISCLMPITYTDGPGDSIYVIGGPAVFVLYVASFLLVLILLFVLIRNKANIPLNQKLSLYFIFFFFVTLTALQLAYFEINDLSYIFTFSIAEMYFTIESQDNKLLNELEKSKEEALAADRAKTEFLSNMSHEIRTPMNTILGFSESILREEKLNYEVVKNDVQSIYDASISLLDLINNILDISRIESGKEFLDEKEYNLENLIFDVNSIICSKINKNDLKFNINVNSNLPSVFYGDYLKIYKVIICTLVNAINHTNYGEVSLSVDGEKNDDTYNLLFLVSNTGHAMKESEFEKDFKDFVKLGNSTQNNLDSVKLGLIIAKRLLMILNGDMEFKNEIGKGTRYIIKIPQKIISEDKIGNIFENPKNGINSSEIISLSGKKALVVDDNKVNIKLASRMFEQFGIEVSSALSGNECINLVKQNNYDIIFLDHMMPELDGIATLKILKRSGCKLPPVIALTANSYTGLKDKYISEGFDDYLSKPINFKDLNKLLNRYFNDKDN